MLSQDGAPAGAFLEVAVEHVERDSAGPRVLDLAGLVAPEGEPGEPPEHIRLERTVADSGESCGSVIRGGVPTAECELVVAQIRQKERTERALEPERPRALQILLADRDRLLEPAHAVQGVVEGHPVAEQQRGVGRGESLRLPEGVDRPGLVALQIACHAELDRGIPGGLATAGAQGELDGLLDGRDPRGGVADQHIGVADEREQARAHLLIARVIADEEGESSFGELATERRARVERRPGLAHQDLGAQAGLVVPAFRERPLQQRGGPIVVARVDPGLTRSEEDLGARPARQLARIRHAGPQLDESLRELADIAVREAGAGVVDGPQGRGERQIRLARRAPMLRDLGGVPRPELGEDFGVAGMEPQPFSGNELSVNCLLQQGVAEAVRVGGRDDELSRDRGGRRLVQGIRIPGVDRGQHVVIDARSTGGQHPQEAAGALLKTVVPHQQQLSQRLGQGAGRQRDEFFDEKRHP